MRRSLSAYCCVWRVSPCCGCDDLCFAHKSSSSAGFKDLSCYIHLLGRRKGQRSYSGISALAISQIGSVKNRDGACVANSKLFWPLAQPKPSSRISIWLRILPCQCTDKICTMLMSFHSGPAIVSPRDCLETSAYTSRTCTQKLSNAGFILYTMAWLESAHRESGILKPAFDQPAGIVFDSCPAKITPHIAARYSLADVKLRPAFSNALLCIFGCSNQHVVDLCRCS